MDGLLDIGQEMLPAKIVMGRTANDYFQAAKWDIYTHISFKIEFEAAEDIFGEIRFAEDSSLNVTTDWTFRIPLFIVTLTAEIFKQYSRDILILLYLW